MHQKQQKQAGSTVTFKVMKEQNLSTENLTERLSFKNESEIKTPTYKQKQNLLRSSCKTLKEGLWAKEIDRF